MAKDPFDTSLAGFRRWAKTAADSLRGGDPVEDAAEVELLTGLMRDYLDIERPADLSKHDLAELLLHVYPRKVVVDSRAEAEDTVRVLHAFLAYLADSGAMREPSARSLARELDKIAPRFADAVMDPANWGPGRMFAQSAAISTRTTRACRTPTRTMSTTTKASTSRKRSGCPTRWRRCGFRPCRN
jgi:hypothetical protein